VEIFTFKNIITGINFIIKRIRERSLKKQLEVITSNIEDIKNSINKNSNGEKEYNTVINNIQINIISEGKQLVKIEPNKQTINIQQQKPHKGFESDSDKTKKLPSPNSAKKKKHSKAILERAKAIRKINLKRDKLKKHTKKLKKIWYKSSKQMEKERKRLFQKNVMVINNCREIILNEYELLNEEVQIIKKVEKERAILYLLQNIERLFYTLNGLTVNDSRKVRYSNFYNELKTKILTDEMDALKHVKTLFDNGRCYSFALESKYKKIDSLFEEKISIIKKIKLPEDITG